MTSVNKAILRNTSIEMSKKFLDYLIQNALSTSKQFKDKFSIEVLLMTVLSFFTVKLTNLADSLAKSVA